jgi:acyl-CoA hydrolase
MRPQTFNYDRLVKSEDLNHHKTLFAGRCAEWFVEAGFIAAASVLPAGNVVCLKVHGLMFTAPLVAGDIACFQSRIVKVGRTSLTTYISLTGQNKADPVISGFITFVHVDSEGKAKPHGLELELETEEDYRLYQQALALN